MIRRTASELVSVDSRWPLVLGWVAEARVDVEILPVEPPARGAKELEALQVTTHSVLGAMAYHSGGILVDHGWLTILGCGHERRPWSISTMTIERGWGGDDGPPSAVAVGFDVLGGLFAINGGAFAETEQGSVFYFDPSSLEWESIEIGHGAWVSAVLDGDNLQKFYEDLRWKGWEGELDKLAPNCGIGFVPPLFTAESRPRERASRRAIAMDELIAVNFEFGRQLGRS